MSDDGSAWYIGLDVLQSRSVQSVAAQLSQRVICMCAQRQESLNVLSDREVVCNDHTQHLHAAATHSIWQWCRFRSMPSPPPSVCKTILLVRVVHVLLMRTFPCPVSRSCWYVDVQRLTCCIVELQSWARHVACTERHQNSTDMVWLRCYTMTPVIEWPIADCWIHRQLTCQCHSQRWSSAG